MLGLCVVATLVFGVVACAALGAKVRFFDESQYLTIAEQLSDHGRYSLNGHDPTAYRTPGYPLLLAAARAAGLGLGGARFLNFFFLAGVVVAAYALGNALGGRRAAAISALLATIYPFFAFTATTFYPQTLATLLLACGTLALLAASRAASRRRGIALGALAGLVWGGLLMVVPSFVFVIPVAVVWLLLTRRDLFLRLAIPLVLASLVLPGLWTVRNLSAFDRFVPLASSGGQNLLVGNNPRATADGTFRFDVLAPYMQEARRRGLGELGRDSFYSSQAQIWMREHPGRAVGLYFEKLLNNFAWSNPLSNPLGTPRQASGLRDLAAALAYLPLLALLIVRLTLARRRPLVHLEWLMLGLYAANALTLAVFVTRARYRFPVDLFMLVVVAALLDAAIAMRSRDQAGLPLTRRRSARAATGDPAQGLADRH